MLSKICIFDIENNPRKFLYLCVSVVNCFQKFVSLTSKTTFFRKICDFALLWIAFKNLYLWHRKQLQVDGDVRARGCELLSKICIFDIENNNHWNSAPFAELWIAFKNLYLWHRKQHKHYHTYRHLGCELLSKICIFDIENNTVLNKSAR